MRSRGESLCSFLVSSLVVEIQRISEIKHLISKWKSDQWMRCYLWIILGDFRLRFCRWSFCRYSFSFTMAVKTEQIHLKKVFVENAKSNKDLRLINTSDVHLKSRKKKSESLIRKDVELFLYLKISKSIFKQLFTVTQILDDLHFIIFVSSIHGRVLW